MGAATNPEPMTTGELIRELIPTFYPDSHSLNLAVNEHRRSNGFKNWYVAAADLLGKEQSRPITFPRGCVSGSCEVHCGSTFCH